MRLVIEVKLLAHRFGKRGKALAECAACVGEFLVSLDDVLLETPGRGMIDRVSELLPGRLQVGGRSLVRDAKQPFGTDLS